MIVCGLDLSTNMGVAFVEGKAGGSLPTLLHKEEVHHDLRNRDEKGRPKGLKKHPLDRWGEYVLSLQPLVDRYQPERVVIENYGFAGHGLAALVEQGTVIRYFLRQWGYDYWLLPPNNLKKFVTGKGAGGKGVVMKEVYKRWGIDCATDNEADAVGLACAGLAKFGDCLDMPQLHLSALDKLSPP